MIHPLRVAVPPAIEPRVDIDGTMPDFDVGLDAGPTHFAPRQFANGASVGSAPEAVSHADTSSPVIGVLTSFSDAVTSRQSAPSGHVATDFVDATDRVSVLIVRSAGSLRALGPHVVGNFAA